MDAQEQEMLKRLRVIFRAEAEEHLNALSEGLIKLEKTAEPSLRDEIVERAFREAHSLKGAAQSVNLSNIEAICHPLESTLSALKRKKIELSPALFDLLHWAVDTLSSLVADAATKNSSTELTDLSELVHKLQEAAQGRMPKQEKEEGNASQNAVAEPRNNKSATATPVQEPTDLIDDSASTFEDKLVPPPHPEPSSSPRQSPVHPSTRESMLNAPETVRISIAKLDPLLRQAEELIQVKIAANQRAGELREIQQDLQDIRAEILRQQGKSTNQWIETSLDTLLRKVTETTVSFGEDHRALYRLVDDHLEAMKQALMLPVATLVVGFPKLVRDLARDQGKEIDLVIRGTEIEVDKRILEELKTPLIHLLRNCVDHGLETPERRIHQGKQAQGKITLTFKTKDGRQLQILVTDDGAGIDAKKVRATAIRSGAILASAAENLTPQEVLQFVFLSGLTTKKIITDISGRGLGLAIVREKIEQLNGTVSVDTQAGRGTTFHLLLPLTLATFRGVVIKANDRKFIIPTGFVERAVRLSRSEIRTVENRETIRLDGEILSLVRLSDVLRLPNRKNGRTKQKSFGADDADTQTSAFVFILILSSAKKRLAFQVDGVLAEEEVLIKGLGKQLSRVRNIAGATILGAGKVVPVLNVADLMISAIKQGEFSSTAVEDHGATPRTGRLLVAEDSITARTLLKNILETDGYQVTTAVDGVDAFTQLQNGDYDLVVSDVDMPRMSGFELTTKIRNDKKLSEIPIILVTALGSSQDRERGIEVGASAYIVKSSFDQSNLLEVVQRLL